MLNSERVGIKHCYMTNLLPYDIKSKAWRERPHMRLHKAEQWYHVVVLNNGAGILLASLQEKNCS